MPKKAGGLSPILPPRLAEASRGVATVSPKLEVGHAAGGAYVATPVVAMYAPIVRSPDVPQGQYKGPRHANRGVVYSYDPKGGNGT